MAFRLSVIIPTYNRESLVQAAVDSTLRQSMPPHEVLVCDDGSSDETVARLRQRFADVPQVKILSLPHSGLPAVARNAGIAASRGDWLAFLDSDDVWLPDKTARQHAAVASHPTLGMVCTNAFVQRHGVAPQLYPMLIRDVPTGDITVRQLLDDNAVVTSSVIVRRSLLVAAGAFSARPQLQSVEDYELWLRIGTLAPIYYLSDPLVVYRDDTADSLRRAQTPSSHWRARLEVLACLRAFSAATGRNPHDRSLPQVITAAEVRCRVQRCAALFRESRLPACLGALSILCAQHPRAAFRELFSRALTAAVKRHR